MIDKEKKEWAKDWDKLKNRSHLDLSYPDYMWQIYFICQHIGFNVFLDCGPGVAFSEAWHVRQALPSCDIMGFEPQVQRFDLLRQHCYPGRLFNVAVSNEIGKTLGAMGHEEGKSDFILDPPSHKFNDNAYKSTSVETVTLDAIIQLTSHIHSDDLYKAFIWADVEGSELKILEGSQAALASGHISGFLLELNTETSPLMRYGGSPRQQWEDIWDWCKQYGYAPIAIFNIQPTHFDCIFKQVDLGDASQYIPASMVYNVHKLHANNPDRDEIVGSMVALRYKEWAEKQNYNLRQSHNHGPKREK